MSLPAKNPVGTGEIMESVLIRGDLAKLTESERVRYYDETCKSMGLNPFTKPFEYITLNGKLQLYALRACTDQLRKINGISLEIVSRDVADGILTVHVRARTPEGRSDEDLGSVPFPDTLKGEFRANMELKAVTKAKRRATLSICGLGWLDETEVEDIPSAAPGKKFLNPSHRPLHEELDDEIPDFADGTPAEGAAAVAASVAAAPSPATGGADLKQTLANSAVLEAALAAVRAGRGVQDVARQLAATHGETLIQAFFRKLTSDQKDELRKIKPDLERLYPK